MKIYRHWVKIPYEVSTDEGSCIVALYCGSNISEEDAKNQIPLKADILTKKINGDNLDMLGDYEVEIREEIVKELDKSNIVTRNRYGALVLNSENIMFVDVDCPPVGFFRHLINLYRGRKSDPKGEALFNIRKLCFENRFRNMHIRVYETFSGLRLLIANTDLEAASEQSAALMEEFNVDPLYSRLCSKQNCYRARLTPKSWRMKMQRIRNVWPPEELSDEKRQKMEKWNEKYKEKSASYAVCRFIERIGKVDVASDIVSLIEYHDKLTGADSNLPLA